MPPFARLLLAMLLLMPNAAQAAPVWGYMGGGNDDEGWGTLTPDFALCDTGTNQSPVGIAGAKKSAVSQLDISYHRTQMQMEKKDRTLVLSIPEGGTLSDEGHLYKLKEIRIHTPAEHEVIGQLYPAELHLIHHDANGKILILAVFMDFAPEGNTALQAIVDKAPHKAQSVVPLTLNPNDLLPKKRGYYSYSGSLSWPPCSEGVEWRVLKEPTALSQAQMQALGALLGRNARLLQPLYLRTVKETIN